MKEQRKNAKRKEFAVGEGVKFERDNNAQLIQQTSFEFGGAKGEPSDRYAQKQLNLLQATNNVKCVMLIGVDFAVEAAAVGQGPHHRPDEGQVQLDEHREDSGLKGNRKEGYREEA